MLRRRLACRRLAASLIERRSVRPLLQDADVAKKHALKRVHAQVIAIVVSM